MQRFHYDTIGSTNVEARALAAARPGTPLLVTAAEQTAGRGRQGRAWHSPRGGAWLSVAWPMAHPPARYAAASLVAGAALRRAVASLGVDARRLEVKWPNDLVIGGRKAAGILCEQFAGAAGAAGSLVIGVGVNVDFDPALFPPDLRTPATTLREALGVALGVDDVVAATAREVAAAMRDFERDGLAEGCSPSCGRR
jgi:BirA family biotin operon repressor/biotin-[acetyl-CoA-carboxylase] ligase